jgi:hypothetical protein
VELDGQFVAGVRGALNTIQARSAKWLLPNSGASSVLEFFESLSTGRRLTPARNFGAMICVPRSKTGKRSATRVIRPAAAKASMSELCCANCRGGRYDGDSGRQTRWARAVTYTMAARVNWAFASIRHLHQYDIPSNPAPESLSGPNAGLTEVPVSAGYVTTVYDPYFSLSPDAARYLSTASQRFRYRDCRSLWSCAPSQVRRIFYFTSPLPAKRIPIGGYPPAFGTLRK